MSTWGLHPLGSSKNRLEKMQTNMEKILINEENSLFVSVHTTANLNTLKDTRVWMLLGSSLRFSLFQ